jgi:transcriptional regulator with XRE-family HTH domain
MIIPSNSPVILGRRLRHLRKIVGLTIVEFAELAHISSPSISYWENGQINHPIKPKSMRKVIEGFKKVGMEVDERWFRTGEGDLPRYKGGLIRLEERDVEPLGANSLSEKEDVFDAKTRLTQLVSEEIKLFTSLDSTVVIRVEHVHLMPFIKPGDFVGGVWQQSVFLTELTICIFQWKHQLRVAGIKSSQDTDRFEVFFDQIPNQEENKSKSMIVPLPKVAPVVRIWRLPILECHP